MEVLWAIFALIWYIPLAGWAFALVLGFVATLILAEKVRSPR